MILFTERLESRQLLSAGDIVPSFGSEGFVSGELFPAGSSSAVVLQADGKVIAAGTTDQAVGATDGQFALARFNSNGSLDRTFGVNGRVITDIGGAEQGIGALVVQKDGKIIAAGSSGRDFALVRYLPSGQLDKTFGRNGIEAVPFSGQAKIAAIALQSNGKIDVAGSAMNTIGQQRFALAQFTTSGRLDPTFGTHGITVTNFPGTGGMADAMVIQPNGGLVVAGGSDVGNETFDYTLARYTPVGKLDPAFGKRGIVVDTSIDHGSDFGEASFTGLALKSNGQIIADGSDGSIVVARFQSNGTIDHSFGVRGVASVSGNSGPLLQAASVLVQKSGDIVVVGTELIESMFFEPSFFFLSRFTPSGAIDNSFGVHGIQEAAMSANSCAFAAVLQPNDRIIVGGDSDPNNELTDFTLARYTLSGQPDGSFGFGGVVQQPNGLNSPIAATLIQSDGKIIAAGTEFGFSGGPTGLGPTAAALVRYNPDGSLDTSFGADGRVLFRIGRNASFDALAIDAHGDIVAGGAGTDDMGNGEFALVRFHPNGTVDASFGKGGVVLTAFTSSPSPQITSMAIQPNGDIVATGTTVNALDQVDVARYLPDGMLDPSFASGGKFARFANNGDPSTSAIALQTDGKIVITGGPNNGFGVFRLLPNGKLDSGFGMGGVVVTDFANEFVASATAIAIDSSGDLVVGGYVLGDDDGTAFALVRYSHVSGKLDPTFGNGGKVTLLLPFGIGEIDSLAIQKNGKIIAGGESQGDINEFQSSAALLRFTTGGALDATFGQGGIVFPANGNEVGPVTSVIVLSNGDILGSASDLFELKGK
jgi:uncharacterized delta-60 repeat protein